MLFETQDSDSDIDIKTNNEYAKSYDNWRQKEELNRLKTKYGEDIDNLEDESSSSSEDDEDCVELTEKIEKDFFKTLSSLKNKDPKIYDEKVNFFDNKPIDTSIKKKKKKNEPMYIKDYERKLLLEKGGQISDSEDETPRVRSPTYVEEQQQLKKSLKDALTNVNEDEEDWGGMFKARTKSKEENEKEESDYKQWLLGQKKSLEDETTVKELKPLKDYWNDPNLDEGEKFLRDYILNKKFLDKEDDENIPMYDEIVHDSDEGLSEDEEAVEKQEEFEHKYNYRFEEPDQDFIKRYPRTMESSLRRTDDRRKLKRAELKDRKQKEKEEKMEDLKKLQRLKKQEIEEKLNKLREITGNTEVAFEGQDVDDDFDPDEHDRRMHALFSDEFYQGEEGDQKPEFPNLDEELEIERWDNYVPGTENDEDNHEDDTAPFCEDDGFNMDCDYDPALVQQELIENSKGKKKRKRKSKFAKALAEPKPAFDPENKTYEEYLDEYYKLDCEDIVGDIPCRFKYRKVIPNNFGLSIDEILKANDRELNRWCSLKKALQHRPDHVEKYDQIAFNKKAQNEALKKKILPSLFSEDVSNEKISGEVVINKNKVQVNKSSSDNETIVQGASKDADTILENKVENTNVGKKRKRKNKSVVKLNEVSTNSDVKPSTSNNKIKRPEIKKEEINKRKKQKKAVKDTSETKTINQRKNVTDVEKVKKNIQNNQKQAVKTNTKDKSNLQQNCKAINRNANKPNNYQFNRKRKHSGSANNSNKKSKISSNENNLGLSDARLQAFGIKPKKFKNKLKYGNNK